MKLIVDKILWGMLLVLFGPSVMVVASWNALPGDNLYGTKLALERAALTITSPSYTTASTLQIKYTERRFAEAKQLLASKQSIQGLPYLQEQIVETKKAIEQAPNKETQVALAKRYINALTTVSTDLEAQKQSITTSSQPIASVPSAPPTVTSTPHPAATPAPTSTSTPTPIQIAQVTTTAPIPTQHAIVALQIDQTQQNVAQTIADLQTLVGEDDQDKADQRDNKQEKYKEKKEKMEGEDKKDERGKEKRDRK